MKTFRLVTIKVRIKDPPHRQSAEYHQDQSHGR